MPALSTRLPVGCMAIGATKKPRLVVRMGREDWGRKFESGSEVEREHDRGCFSTLLLHASHVFDISSTTEIWLSSCTPISRVFIELLVSNPYLSMTSTVKIFCA
ncbi:hypothetical protein FRC03_002305 [Tulasnella sp. 419]|nr:hypothetical protein FRC03_002305 [Tulasnella sp. 419]